MHPYAKITTGCCLMAALMVAPAFAQTGGSSGTGTSGTGSSSGAGSTSGTGGTSGSGSMPSTQPGATPRGGSSGRNQPGMSSSDTMQGSGSMHDKTGNKADKSKVRQVQEALKAQGHDPGPIDGVMGPQTQEAIRAYQRSQNLTETGRLDAQTTEKLGIGSGMSGSGSSSGGSQGTGSQGSGSSGTTGGTGSQKQ